MRSQKFMGGLLCICLFPWALAFSMLYLLAAAGAILLNLAGETERYLRGRLLRDPK